MIWVIGITNLQSPLARLKAFWGMCQFAACESLVVGRGWWVLIGLNEGVLIGAGYAAIGQNRGPGEWSGWWRVSYGV